MQQAARRRALFAALEQVAGTKRWGCRAKRRTEKRLQSVMAAAVNPFDLDRSVLVQFLRYQTLAKAAWKPEAHVAYKKGCWAGVETLDKRQ